MRIAEEKTAPTFRQAAADRDCVTADTHLGYFNSGNLFGRSTRRRRGHHGALEEPEPVTNAKGDDHTIEVTIRQWTNPRLTVARCRQTSFVVLQEAVVPFDVSLVVLDSFRRERRPMVLEPLLGEYAAMEHVTGKILWQ